MKSNLGLAQKILLISLYGFIVLMIIFSIGALENIGKKGYDNCIQEKCERKGEAWCSKYREISNCCLGAGGQLTTQGNKMRCFFS